MRRSYPDRRRYGIDERAILADLRAGMIDQLSPDPAVADALTEVVSAGFVPYVVTNGTVAQQEAKLRRTGLDRLVAGWTVSEGAGVRKPARRIFELAAAAAGLPLSASGWMVGDHSEFDVGGGAAAGLRTAWISRGGTWPAGLPYRPTLTAETAPIALRQMIHVPAPEAHR